MDVSSSFIRDRRIAASDARRFRRSRGTRSSSDITTIILHQTSGNSFLPASSEMRESLETRELSRRERRQLVDAIQRADRRAYPTDASQDALVESDHQIDEILAHFVVMNDGTVFYTLDTETLSGSAGGRRGIDIEFAGIFNEHSRLNPSAIESGRSLIRLLKDSISTIQYIHPHGQVQRENMDGTPCGGTTGVRAGKLNSCPGPDVWVNVGAWAVRNLRLTTEQTDIYYQNNFTNPSQLYRGRQSDASFQQPVNGEGQY